VGVVFCPKLSVCLRRISQKSALFARGGQASSLVACMWTKPGLGRGGGYRIFAIARRSPTFVRPAAQAREGCSSMSTIGPACGIEALRRSTSGDFGGSSGGPGGGGGAHRSVIIGGCVGRIVDRSYDGAYEGAA